jgi:hypothetical protein
MKIVTIWGGSNDVNRNESIKGLMNLNEFVDQRNNTNIMIVTIPHRHDWLHHVLRTRYRSLIRNYIKS